MNNREKKEALTIESKRTKKGKKRVEIAPEHPISVYEYLTNLNMKILNVAKELKDRKITEYVWFRRNVFVKKRVDSQPIRINSINQVEEIYSVKEKKAAKKKKEDTPVKKMKEELEQ